MNLLLFQTEPKIGFCDFSFVVVKGWSWDTCHDVDAGVMAPCPLGEVWRPLCPYRHSGKERAARRAAVWALLAGQEGEAEVLEIVIVWGAVDSRTQIKLGKTSNKDTGSALETSYPKACDLLFSSPCVPEILRES